MAIQIYNASKPIWARGAYSLLVASFVLPIGGGLDLELKDMPLGTVDHFQINLRKLHISGVGGVLNLNLIFRFFLWNSHLSNFNRTSLVTNDLPLYPILIVEGREASISTLIQTCLPP